MKIKDLPAVDRPREKLVKYGAEKLSNAELLAILLRSGSGGVNVVEMSQKILQKFGGAGLAQAAIPELKRTFGLGEAKACEIVACFELGRRMLQNKKAALLMTPADVWVELKDLQNHKKEHFITFFLDARNREIRRETISIGTLTANLVHPREVFEPAIRHTAAQIIVAHNHPSGNPDPSDADITITKRLVEAGKLLGIELLDHIIIAKNGYCSLKERHHLD